MHGKPLSLSHSHQNLSIIIPDFFFQKKKLTDAKAAMLLAEGVLTVPNSNEFEVWVHENCCVWASGVYLVGSKLQGLDDAVWAACGTVSINTMKKRS